jgi:hypothetical protein
VANQGEEPSRGGGRVADAVDEQVGAVAERAEQLLEIVAVRCHEPPSGRGDLGGHVRRVAPGQVDLPAGLQQATGCGPSDLTGTADDQGPRHHGERTAASSARGRVAANL